MFGVVFINIDIIRAICMPLFFEFFFINICVFFEILFEKIRIFFSFKTLLTKTTPLVLLFLNLYVPYFNPVDLSVVIN